MYSSPRAWRAEATRDRGAPSIRLWLPLVRHAVAVHGETRQDYRWSKCAINVEEEYNQAGGAWSMKFEVWSFGGRSLELNDLKLIGAGEDMKSGGVTAELTPPAKQHLAMQICS